MFSGQHILVPRYSHYGFSGFWGGLFAWGFFGFFHKAIGIRTAASFPFAVQTREMCLVLSGRNSLMGKIICGPFFLLSRGEKMIILTPTWL